MYDFPGARQVVYQGPTLLDGVPTKIRITINVPVLKAALLSDKKATNDGEALVLPRFSQRIGLV